MSDPERLRVATPGLTFEALAWGEPGGPLALCLHGYPDTPGTWRHLGPHLAALGWRVVAPFTRGYSPTDLAPEDDYSVQALARDAAALHAALGGDDRAVLIGHDWGALTVYEVTRSAPGLFRRHVALAVPPAAVLFVPFTRLRTLPLALRQGRRSWYTLFQQLPGISERSLDRLVPALWARWSPGFDGRADAAAALAAMSGPGRRRAVLRYYRDNLRPGGIRAGCRPPGAPVLLLHGETDGCLGAELLPLGETLLAPASHTVLVRRAGHFLQLEQPALVNEAIAEWIGT